MEKCSWSLNINAADTERHGAHLIPSVAIKCLQALSDVAWGVNHLRLRTTGLGI